MEYDRALVWQHQSKEGVGISENNGEQLSSKRIMGIGWKGTQREVIKNFQVLYKVVLKTGSDDAIFLQFLKYICRSTSSIFTLHLLIPEKNDIVL